MQIVRVACHLVQSLPRMGLIIWVLWEYWTNRLWMRYSLRILLRVPSLRVSGSWQTKMFQPYTRADKAKKPMIVQAAWFLTCFLLSVPTLLKAFRFFGYLANSHSNTKTSLWVSEIQSPVCINSRIQQHCYKPRTKTTCPSWGLSRDRAVLGRETWIGGGSSTRSKLWSNW